MSEELIEGTPFHRTKIGSNGSDSNLHAKATACHCFPPPIHALTSNNPTSRLPNPDKPNPTRIPPQAESADNVRDYSGHARDDKVEKNQPDIQSFGVHIIVKKEADIAIGDHEKSIASRRVNITRIKHAGPPGTSVAYF